MKDKILLVDDDANILAGFKRFLGRKFNIETAVGGETALDIIDDKGPFAVIVSDMRMPNMNGVEFLAQVRIRTPDSVRMLLTGQADLNETIAVINEGHIFRFLSKPCSPDILANALDAGLEQYRLVTAEKELLEKTLKGSIKLLVDVLSIVSPDAFSRSIRLRKLATKIASRLNLQNMWEVDLAALFSQIGCVTLPPELLQKKYQGQSLTDAEHEMFMNHSRIGRDLLINIPRLQEIAEAIAHQFICFDGSGSSAESIKGEQLHIISRILKVIQDFDSFTSAGQSPNQAFASMTRNRNWYDPDVLSALEAEILNVEEGFIIREVSAKEVEIGMVLADDLRSKSGALMVPKNYEISQVLKIRILNFAQTDNVAEPIKILDWIEQK